MLTRRLAALGRLGLANGYKIERERSRKGIGMLTRCLAALGRLGLANGYKIERERSCKVDGLWH